MVLCKTRRRFGERPRRGRDNRAMRWLLGTTVPLLAAGAALFFAGCGSGSSASEEAKTPSRAAKATAFRRARRECARKTIAEWAQYYSLEVDAAKIASTYAA